MHTWYNRSIIFLLLFASPFAFACEITMGYRTTDRLPNIEASPSNAGLYYELYSKAASMINCNLVVIRLPKKRVLLGLKNGTIDFYPGLTYSDERAKYIYFVNNGLPSANVGLSHKTLPEIKSYADLKEKTVLMPLGGPVGIFKGYGVNIFAPSEISFEKAINIILLGRADFYEDEFATLSYYLKNHPRKHELKYHLNCCGGLQMLTLGFSRASIHYREESNPNFDSLKDMSPYNYPVRATKDSLAFIFFQALARLKVNGFTDNLYKQYYGYNLEEMFSVQENN